MLGSSLPTDLVTEAGPANATVTVGGEANLWCKIRTSKALAIAPFVQWMKRVEEDEMAGDKVHVINVGKERFKVIEKGRQGRLYFCAKFRSLFSFCPQTNIYPDQ